MTISAAFAAKMKKVLGESHETEIAGWLDTTYPPLNKIISGDPDRGLPYGRIVEIYGPSGAGKSWLSTQLMIETQRAGGIPILMDHEYSANLDYSRRQGLNTEEPYFFKREPDTLEDSFDIACDIVTLIRDEGAIDPKAPILIVFDSVHAMVPKEKFEKEKTADYNMRDRLALAAALSTSMPKANQVAAKKNAIFLFLNQVREIPGVVYGDPTTTPGGNTMEFYASVRLALGRKLVKEEVAGEKEVTGQIIGLTTKKNRFNAPFQESQALLRFTKDGGSEFDRITGLLQVLIAEGKLQYAKPRATWTDGKQYFVKALAEKIRDEGLYDELVRLYKS